MITEQAKRSLINIPTSTQWRSYLQLFQEVSVQSFVLRASDELQTPEPVDSRIESRQQSLLGRDIVVHIANSYIKFFNK